MMETVDEQLTDTNTESIIIQVLKWLCKIMQIIQ